MGEPAFAATEPLSLGELSQLHAELGLTGTDLATALGVDQRTVDRWFSARTYPQHEARQRLRALLDLYRHARVTFSTSEAAREWLQAPHRYLGWLSPAEVIRAGRFDRVEGALEVMDSGVFI